MQKEDIYETEDIPSPEPKDTEEKFESDDVEKIHVDIDGAIKLFGNRILNADDVDFSDSLFKKKRRGYRSGNYILEIVGSENHEPETIPQKFRRLRFELEELNELVEKQMEAKKEDAKFVGISKAELDNLSDLLRAATLKSESITQSTPTPQNSVEVEGTKVKGVQFAKTSHGSLEKLLDERIKRIEMAVNGATSQRSSHHEPLIEIIENLRVQVESLNPAYLDGAANQLKTAITKLSEYDDKRKKISVEEFDGKINELYKLVLQWDATCTNLPSIVRRLHSLSKLHEQAQHFATRLEDMTAVKEHLEKKTENQQLVLHELKRESAKTIGELSEKVVRLEQRLAAALKPV